MINKIRQIFSGWYNLVRKDDDIEKMALIRKNICLECPHIRNTTCNLCGCPLPPKTRSVGSTCPDGRWTV